MRNERKYEIWNGPLQQGMLSSGDEFASSIRLTNMDGLDWERLSENELDARPDQMRLHKNLMGFFSWVLSREHIANVQMGNKCG